MSWNKPIAIIVTGSYKQDNSERTHWAEYAHEVAHDIFSKHGLPGRITEVLPDELNDVRSFLIGWDGSKEGWDESDKGNAAREEFKEWLHAQRYSDGSSPFKWVEVQYDVDPQSGEDDIKTRVIDYGDSRDDDPGVLE